MIMSPLQKLFTTTDTTDTKRKAFHIIADVYLVYLVYLVSFVVKDLFAVQSIMYSEINSSRESVLKNRSAGPFIVGL